MRLRAKTWLVWACSLPAACADDPKIDLPTETSRTPISDTGDASTRVAPCDQAPDGTPCGLDMHCIFNVCSENVCGDGVPLGAGEACDDGNDRDHDGCDSRCGLEVMPGCGNGVREPGEQCDDSAAVSAGTCTSECTLPSCGDNIVSPGEECDDGNGSDGDRCSRRCLTIPERCGNGDKDSSEACDDGNNVDGDGCQSNCTLAIDAGIDVVLVDGGSSTLDGGTPNPDSGTIDSGVGTMDSGVTPPDAGTRPVFGSAHEVAACKECRERECSEYQGLLPLLTACFQNEDPMFIQQCIDLMECAYQKNCGYNVTGMVECFCGTFDKTSCQVAGNQNGLCMAEVYAAARTRDLSTLIPLFGDVSLPLGVAVYFQECDATLCPSCKP